MLVSFIKSIYSSCGYVNVNSDCSSSTADIRSLRKQCEKNLSFDETLISSAVSSASQYYSAVNVENQQSVETKSGSSSQCSNDDDNDDDNDGDGYDDTSSNESRHTMEQFATPSSSDPLHNDRDLFDGKKPLFDDDASFDTPALQRSSTSVKCDRPNLNSIISLDDSMANGNFDSTNSTEVWSFGKNSYGQLGHGDLDDRYLD